MKRNKKIEMILPDNYCPRCGSLNVTVLSDETILCNNPSCLAVSKFDVENNELNIKFKVK